MNEKETTNRQQLQHRLTQELPQTEQAVPAFNDFLGQLIVQFGGPDVLAAEYYQTYKDAKKGSSARVQLMLKMTELLLRNTQHFGAPAKVEEMSDAEISAVLGAFLKSSNNDQSTDETDGSGSSDASAEEPESTSEIQD